MNADCWSRNLGVLARHPHVVERMRQHEVSSPAGSVVVEVSRKGDPTLSCVDPGGRVFTYHSKYDPKGEAARQVSAIWRDEAHVLVLGLGLGYALDEVMARLGSRGGPGQVMVIEPDPAVFRALLETRDVRSVLADPRIDWYVGSLPDEAGERWHMNLDWTAMESFLILDHPPSRARFPEFFDRVMEKIRYLSNRSKGNLVTLMHSGFDFHTNNFLNLARIFPMPGVGRLFGKFAGVPAIIVAAGPSLDKNVHLLREIKDRFLIIAVDTAFRQLVHHGIRPDIVCAADPSYENSLDFVGVEHERDVILAVEPMTHPDILESFTGPQMSMTFGGGLFPMYQAFREPVGTVVCWGSIATTTFDLARSLGCDPIVFIGLDLSFEDGRLHARGSFSDDVFFDQVHHLTSVEHETTDYILTRGTFRFDRPDGPAMYTDHNMHLYRGWFEDQFQQTRQQVINATEGGVVQKHVVTMPLAEVIRRFSQRGSAIRPLLRAALEEPVAMDAAGFRARLAGLLRDLRQQESEVRQGVASLRKLSRRCAGFRVENLTGPTREDFFGLLRLHDRLCNHKDLFAWMTVHQTKFMTRHTMEVKSLKGQANPPANEWLALMSDFFAAQNVFHEYQIPLLEQSMHALETMRPQADMTSPTGGGR